MLAFTAFHVHLPGHSLLCPSDSVCLRFAVSPLLSFKAPHQGQLMVPGKRHCRHNRSLGRLDSGVEGKELPSGRLRALWHGVTPCSEMPVVLGENTRRPSCRPRSGHAALVLTPPSLGGCVSEQISLHRVILASLPHGRGSTFPINHLPRAQAALQPLARGCTWVRGPGPGRQEKPAGAWQTIPPGSTRHLSCLQSAAPA